MMSKDRNLKWFGEAKKPPLPAHLTEENNKWEITLKQKNYMDWCFSQKKLTQFCSGQRTHPELD